MNCKDLERRIANEFFLTVEDIRLVVPRLGGTCEQVATGSKQGGYVDGVVRWLGSTYGTLDHVRRLEVFANYLQVQRAGWELRTYNNAKTPLKYRAKVFNLKEDGPIGRPVIRYGRDPLCALVVAALAAFGRD